MKRVVKRVKKLKTEGKSYNIFFRKKLALNLTLEEGQEMTLWLAVNILSDMLRQHNLPTDMVIADVDFEEAEPDLT